MKKCWLVLGLMLWTAGAQASLPGDVNGDGAVNVADLVRTQKIYAGELAFEAAADVDGDDAVTHIDVWLIQNAVMGRPIPELVDSGTFGAGGGTLSHGDITFTIPPGSIGQTHLALMRCADDTLADGTPLHQVYMVVGLSTNLAGFTVSYANCASDTGLSLGAYLKPYDTGEMQWYWQVFVDSDFVRNGTQVSRTFPAPGAGDLAISHSLKFALVTAVPPPPVEPEPQAYSKGLVTTADTGVPGNRYAGFRDTGWISPLFHVYTANWGTVTYTHLETVCGYLYDVYNKIQAMGFPLETEHAGVFPIVVRVDKGILGDGGSVHNPVTGSRWLEINAKLLALPGELKATVGHEVMHYVLAEYTKHNSFALETMEDAITTWFEATAADDPTHLAGNFNTRRAAPLKSLFVPITRNWYGTLDWSSVEQHGYAVSAFIDYHFEHRHNWIFNLATKVKSGANIENALDSLFTENLGVLYGLDRQYLAFARDYLMTESNRYSSLVMPDGIFASDALTDVSRMYKLVSLKQATTNLLEEQEVDLQVQDYGCGVIQFKIFKPDRVFAPHTKLRATAPKICNSLDLLMFTRSASGTAYEIVNGVYGKNADDEDEWSCIIPLQKDAQFILISVLTTIANEGNLSNYTETHDVKLKYQFEGDHFMPMQESFVRFTEHSTRETYYDSQVICDAILRIIDPAGLAGLERFNVERTTEEAPFPDVNYTLNYGVSAMVAARRTPGAFQIQLFSSMTVPDLPPYTINMSTNSYWPIIRDYQNPVLAADGSPQVELMVYYAAEETQVTPGSSDHRTQHIITSVNALRQSADGLSGGVLIDIPAQESGKRCLIYAIASDSNEPLGQTAFVVVLNNVPDGGQ